MKRDNTHLKIETCLRTCIDEEEGMKIETHTTLLVTSFSSAR